MFYKILSSQDLDRLRYEDKKCKLCGTTLNSYKKTGRLGCSECYNIFENEINGMITNAYGKVSHKGKFPKSYRLFEENVGNIKEKLRYAIEREDYIEAAKLRDLLKEKSKKG